MQCSSSREIEQRYGVDENSWLYLPKTFLEYHQAEIASGKIEQVVKKFAGQANGVLQMGEYTEYRASIASLLSSVWPQQRIKIRIRRIFNPKKWSLHAEFTLKEKLLSLTWKFKVYQEHNIIIDPEFALKLIEHVAPWFLLPDGTFEYWVRKRRYIVKWPDGKRWDVDKLLWYNTGLSLAEIEVASEDEIIDLPSWAAVHINGNPMFKCFWTAELQKTPWLFLPRDIQDNYLQAVNAFRYEKRA